MENFEHVTLIANPVAQNGAGAAAAARAFDALRGLYGADHVEMQLTSAAGHGSDLARQAAESGADAVVVLGGDGIVHEAVNGLMAAGAAIGPIKDAGMNAAANVSGKICAADQLPVLGVIPLGSGNDYARSIGMPEGVSAAVAALREAQAGAVDLGLVNGHYFAETLSFGLDAAIALGTVEQRKISGHKGTRLYMEVGFDQLMHHLDTHSYTAEIENCVRMTYQGESFTTSPMAPAEDGALGAGGGATHPEVPANDSASEVGGGAAFSEGASPANTPSIMQIANQSITFAVQVGPTYGGGFRICPDAQLDDGLLDVCIAHPPVSVLRAIGIFVRAKNGKHTHYNPMEFFRCTGMTVRFAAPVPTQMDGEPLVAEEYRISVVPRALRVLQR